MYSLRGDNQVQFHKLTVTDLGKFGKYPSSGTSILTVNLNLPSIRTPYYVYHATSKHNNKTRQTKKTQQ